MQNKPKQPRKRAAPPPSAKPKPPRKQPKAPPAIATAAKPAPAAQAPQMATGSDRNREAKIEGIFGATGAGKTSYVMECLKRDNPDRLLIWDTKGEFAREGYATPVYSVKEALEAMRRPTFRIAYKPSLPATITAGKAARAMRDQFGLFCLGAFAAKNLTLVAEELAETTTPNVAPYGWMKCTTQGRTEGLTIYGLSQQPASVDKQFFANCSKIRTGRLNFDAHIVTMANLLGVPKDEIRGLLPLHYVERAMGAGGETLRGSLI